MEDNKDNKEQVKEQTQEKPQKKSRKKTETKAEKVTEGKEDTKAKPKGQSEGKGESKQEEKPVVKEEAKAEAHTEAHTEAEAASEAKASTKTMAEKAIDHFAQMMVTRMEEMKGQRYEKGWIEGGGKLQGLPQNLSGERYYGHNDFFLQLHTAMNGYDTPVYATYKQIKDAGATINKGEKAMPVIYWNTVHRDESGQKVSDEAYKALTKEEQAKVKTVPVMMGYYVWNLQQTDFPEVKPELFAKLQEQFKLKDASEKMYQDGMEHLSSIVQKKSEPTGEGKGQGKEAEGHYADAKYAKGALASELTAAVVGNSMGIDKRIAADNAKYVDGWQNTLKEDPRFILSVMADVNKAAKVILDHIDKQRVEQGLSALQPKEQETKAATSQQKSDGQQQTAQAQTAKTVPMEQFNKLETDDGKKIDHFAVFKMKSGNYGLRAMVDGQQLAVKPLDKEDRNAYFERTTTKSALVQKYYGKELSQLKKEQRSKSRAV